MQKLFEDIYIHLKNNRCLKEALNSAFWGIFKIKKATFKSCFFGADGGNRTHMQFLAPDFESGPSTSFSTSAYLTVNYNIIKKIKSPY